jgi:hypothetical protein
LNTPEKTKKKLQDKETKTTDKKDTKEEEQQP